MKEETFETQFQKLWDEIYGIEYFKTNKLTMSCGKDKYKEVVETGFTDKDGNKLTREEVSDGWKVSILKGTQTLYHRTVVIDASHAEGETKYICLLYTYKDILNAGMQLIHLSFVEQMKMLDEIAKAHSGLKPGQKIVA